MYEAFFSKHFNKPEGAVTLPRLEINHPIIREIYQKYGICSSNDGFYRIIDPEDWQEHYMPWFLLMRDEDGVYKGSELYPFMTTAFGYAYIFSNLENATVAGYIDITENFHTLGHANTLFNDILLDDISYKFNLHGDIYEELSPVEPLLGPNECFGFFPPVSMGGEAVIENVQRVKLREHLHFLAQASGLPEE